MKTKEGYLIFVKEFYPKRTTPIVYVKSNSNKRMLGEIKWYSPWRQFAFFPYQGTIWNPDCLLEINNKISELMEERG